MNSGKLQPLFCQCMSKRMAVTASFFDYICCRNIGWKTANGNCFRCQWNVTPFDTLPWTTRTDTISEITKKLKNFFLKCKSESCVCQNSHCADFLGCNIHFRCECFVVIFYEATFFDSKSEFTLIRILTATNFRTI